MCATIAAGMIRLEYALVAHGWATATLSDGTNSAEVTASYLTDALGDLSRAVIALLRGCIECQVCLG
jgi:hypothetical protein